MCGLFPLYFTSNLSKSTLSSTSKHSTVNPTPPHHFHPWFKLSSARLVYQSSSLMSAPVSPLPVYFLQSGLNPTFTETFGKCKQMISHPCLIPPVVFHQLRPKSTHMTLVKQRTGSVPCLSLWLHLFFLFISLILFQSLQPSSSWVLKHAYLIPTWGSFVLAGLTYCKTFAAIILSFLGLTSSERLLLTPSKIPFISVTLQFCILLLFSLQWWSLQTIRVDGFQIIVHLLKCSPHEFLIQGSITIV